MVMVLAPGFLGGSAASDHQAAQTQEGGEMTHRRAVPRFARCERQVEEMVDRRRPFDEIQDAIEATGLPADEKAALWIVAWSLDEPEPRRSDHGHLSLVG
jgi:hypothetical protein